MEKTEALGSFIDQVRWLHEVDFGDFKRRVGLYILRTEATMALDKLNSVRDLFAQMRQDLLYVGHADVEVTRKRMIELAEQIRARLSVRH